MRVDRQRAAGVTLLEMMVSVAIIALVGTLAVPGLNDLRQDNERTAAVNSFIHALFLARSEAIRRGTVVSLCKSADGQTCSNSIASWNAGWMVFVNTDRDDLPVRDPGEEVVSVYQGWPAGQITSNRAAYSFRSYTQSVVNGTLIFCDPRGSAHARAIIISQTGRPRVTQRDSSNRPLRCS